MYAKFNDIFIIYIMILLFIYINVKIMWNVLKTEVKIDQYVTGQV